MTITITITNYHVMGLLQTGFGLVIRFTGLLGLVTTSFYSAIANSYTLQFIASCIVFSACCDLSVAAR
jgi:hypothetical protein